MPQTAGVHVGPARSDSSGKPLSYKVLALKYRPATFDEVVGQTTVIRTLRNAIERDRIGHAFLLSGARGVGKTTTARILAKALNCSRGDVATAEPCGECDSCLEIAAGKSLDVQEIDGASNNSVEQVRELRESARYSPARDRFKIWIIDEVHMLTTGAFNALLKTLEEPPPSTTLVLVTPSPEALPGTVRSRTTEYRFLAEPLAALESALESGGLERDDAWLTAVLGGGSVESARAWAEVHLEEAREFATELRELEGSSASRALDFAESFRGGRNVRESAELLLAVHGALARREIESAAHDGDAARLERWLVRADAGLRARREMVVRNLNPQLVVEGLVLDLVR